MHQLAAILLLLALGVAAAAREKQPARAVVTFSDGATAGGMLTIMGDKPLTMVPLDGKRQQHFAWDDLLGLDHRPEKAEMARPWTFKESGKHDKVYLEGEYPLINFVTTLHLVDGTDLTGHILSAVLVLQDDRQRERIFLKRQVKGEIGQTLEDLVYPESIRFPEHVPAGARTLAGTVRGAGKLQDVRAVDLERLQVLVATLAGDRFDFGNVLPGRYDLCVLTDNVAALGLADVTPSTYPEDTDLQEGDLAALREAFPKADDFFNDRWLLAAEGHRDFARTLIYKRRDDYYDAKRLTPGGFLWHLEVWDWHLAGEDEWKLDRRHILARHRQRGGETVRRLLRLPALTAVPAGTELDIDLSTANEAPDAQALRNLD